MAAERRQRTAHQSHALQLRACQRAGRLVQHARTDAARRRREAAPEDLLPAGQPARTTLHPGIDRVRGFTADVARFPVIVQRHGSRRHSRQSSQSSLPAPLSR